MVQKETLFIVGVDELPAAVSLGTLRELPGVISIVVREADGADGADGNGVGSPVTRLAIALREDAALGGVISALAAAGAHLREISKSEPTLEEVFVQLVGRGISESDSEQAL
jgi:ABC-2 type transport system ATP-binding protein